MYTCRLVNKDKSSSGRHISNITTTGSHWHASFQPLILIPDCVHSTMKTIFITGLNEIFTSGVWFWEVTNVILLCWPTTTFPCCLLPTLPLPLYPSIPPHLPPPRNQSVKYSLKSQLFFKTANHSCPEELLELLWESLHGWDFSHHFGCLGRNLSKVWGDLMDIHGLLYCFHRGIVKWSVRVKQGVHQRWGNGDQEGTVFVRSELCSTKWPLSIIRVLLHVL